MFCVPYSVSVFRYIQLWKHITSVNDSRRASQSSRECVCGPRSFTEHKDKAGQTACLAAMYTRIHPAVNQLCFLKEQANASLQSTSILTGFWPSKHPCVGSKYLSCYYLLQLRVQDLIWYSNGPPFLPHYKWCRRKEARYKQYFCVVCNEFLVSVTEHVIVKCHLVTIISFFIFLENTEADNIVWGC